MVDQPPSYDDCVLRRYANKWICDYHKRYFDLDGMCPSISDYWYVYLKEKEKERNEETNR